MSIWFLCSSINISVLIIFMYWHNDIQNNKQHDNKDHKKNDDYRLGHNELLPLDDKIKLDKSAPNITLDQIKKTILDNSTDAWSTPTNENTIIFDNDPKLQIKAKGQVSEPFTEPWWSIENGCQLYDYEIVYDNNSIQTLTFVVFDSGRAMIPSPFNSKIDSFKYKVVLIILDTEKQDGSALTEKHVRKFGFRVF